MSKTTLRSYNHEIQALTDQGKIDEAIAHCQHILKAYPKHVDTYRLLGKAYLENQRLGDAADLFQRVLSAVPEDFVSHIGMSIIREDEGNLNAAIWHMQRAFDVQSSNITIQDELRRLYGKRDGIEPPKIRLTRAALAHMYSQGDLIDESIAELRTALQEEPERMDMLLLLARMYQRNSQRIKAVQTCSQILNKLPYCLEANIIISQLLRETNREREAAAYIQRARELDPYVAYISHEVPRADLVPEAAITLNRLSDTEIRGLFQASSEQPSWASALGVTVQDQAENETDDIDWLLTESSSGIGDDAALAASLASSPAFAFDEMEELGTEKAAGEPADMEAEIQEPEPPAPADHIPEWMKEAGWGPKSERTSNFGSRSQPQEPEIDLPSESDMAEEIVPAEIPDWLQSMAPESLADETAPQESEEVALGTSGADLPDWLSGLEPQADDQLSAAPGELPDWLKDLGPADAVEIAKPAVPPEMSEAIEEPHKTGEGLPDWLLDADTELEMEQTASEAENLPAWLDDIGEEQLESVEEELAGIGPVAGEAAPEFSLVFEEEVIQQDSETDSGESDLDWLSMDEDSAAGESIQEAAGDQEIPDWLSELSVDRDQAEPVDLVGESLEKTDLPDWLRELAPEEGAETQAELENTGGELPRGEVELSEWIPEELFDEEPAAAEGDVVSEQQEADGIPDWVQQLANDPSAVQGPSTGVTQWLEKHEQEEAGPEEAEDAAEDLPVWLQAFDTELVSKEDDEDLEPAEMAQSIPADPSIPDWLQNLDAEISESADPSWVTMDELEEQDVEVTMEEQDDLPELPDMDDSDAALRWLENLAANQGAKEEELLTSPEERSEAPPDWLQDMVDEAAEGGDMTEMAAGDETVLEIPAMEEAEGSMPEAEEEAAEEAEPWAEVAGDLMDETVLEMDEGSEEEEEEPETISTGWVRRDPLPDWLRDDSIETIMEADSGEAEAEASELEGMDPDQALAWLEGLAAKQGADEAELLTDPEDRPEDTPDWLAQAEAELEEEEGSTAETVVAHAEEAAEDAEEEVDEMAAAGWIDSLVEDEPAGEGEEEPGGEEVPDWLVDELEEGAEEEEPELPDWLQGVELEEEEAGSAEMGVETVMEAESDELEGAEPAVPDWLRETIVSESPFAEPAEQETEAVQESASPPDWVTSEMEPPEDTEEEAEYAWMAPEESEEAAAVETEVEEVEAETPVEESPSLAADTIPSSMAFEDLQEEEEEEEEELEAGEVAMEAAGEEVESAVPAEEEPAELEWPEELQEEEEEELDWLVEAAGQEPEPVSEQAEAPEPMWPAEEAFEADEMEPVPAMSLEDARGALSGGDLSAALDGYNTLIAQRDSLDDVITDLKEAIEYNHPVNVDVWQTLGDAYARNNQLQDALDAYTQAEELLR